MALISTAGSASANSYTSVSLAHAFLRERLWTDAWDTASLGQQETSLIAATRALNTQAEWYGCPTTTTQALPFPATAVTDRAGHAIASDVVPDDVQRATAWYALALLTDPAETAAAKTQQQIAALRDDTLDITYRDRPLIALARDRVPSDIRRLLTPYGWLPDGQSAWVTRT